MTSLWRPEPPRGGDPHDEYAMWDAAYVLGSLSPAERREFEAQMADCTLCSNAVGELSGIPALLSLLDRDTVAAIDEAERSSDALVPRELLPALQAKVSWRRHRSRAVTWTAQAAAAAVLAIGALVGVHCQSQASLHTQSQASPSVQPMAQVGTNKLTSTVSLADEPWGTSISMNCICLAPLTAPHDKLAMLIVGRDGSRTRMATWTANPGHTAAPVGSTSTHVDQIASVQVVSADSGAVLLERSL
jgi:anti-sigma factor RsiW